MKIISLCKLLQAASVEVHAVQMFIIWIFVCVLTVCGEIDDAGLFIDLDHILHMPWALCDAVLQISLVVVEVQVSPAVTLAPLDEPLSSVEDLQRTCLLICVHPFFDDRHDAVLTYGICTYIDAVEVAAAAGQEETVVVSLPYAGHILGSALLLLHRP